MGLQLAVRNSLVIYVVLFFTLVSFSETDQLNKGSKTVVKDIDTISQLIDARTAGNDAFYSKVLSPAQSLDKNKSRYDRILSANQSIKSELALVLGAFEDSTEDKKLEAVTGAAARIEPNLGKNGNAFITFYDTNPSGGVSRTLLMIPKSLKPELSALGVMNILTSFKHSPKPSDHIFEYQVATDLTQGSTNHVVGTDSTWLGDGALSPFPIGQDVALKKCRQLLGWKCITSLYRADSLSTKTQVLFISVYDLENNPDNSEFAKDKRAINQISGSTGIYTVKESSDWILVYGMDTQWSDGKLSFQGAIQTEFGKDFERFKQRISNDLGVTADQLK